MENTFRQMVEELANLNLKIIKELQLLDYQDVPPELLREVRENAQVLNSLV